MGSSKPLNSAYTGAKAGIVGDRDYSEGPGPEIMAASTLEGNSVVNGQGVDLGTIKEIMIDVPNGSVAYAVLSFGGLLGLGDKLYAIPWAALTLDTDNKCFILDIDAERLEAAPGFDKDHWPAMADRRWANEVHTYYGQRNDWRGDEIGSDI
jgi:sporulation protein YlmC with PRC-barrel domain